MKTKHNNLRNCRKLKYSSKFHKIHAVLQNAIRIFKQSVLIYIQTSNVQINLSRGGCILGVFYLLVCSTQSKDRYNSGIVLCKVRILTLSTNSGIVPDSSRIAQEIL